MAVGIVVIALVCVVVKINFGSRKSTDNKKSEQKAQLHDSITGYTEQYFEDGILYVDDNYMRFCSNTANEDGLICARPNCNSVLLHSLPYLPRAPPSGELASECETERVVTAPGASARRHPAGAAAQGRRRHGDIR